MDTRDTNQMSQSASLCRSGCGFYGNPASDGLCSKCYKDALKRKQSAPTQSQTSSVTAASVGHIAPGRANSPTSASVIIDTSTSSSSLVDSLIGSTTGSLNTASQIAPSAIPPPAQDANKLEGAAKSEHSNPQMNANADCSIAEAGSSETTGSDCHHKPPKISKKKKTKCTKCKTNIGVIGFPCRCGGMFCSVHRYTNEHNCTFDYKEAGAEEIRKNNPQVIGEKIQKI